MDNNALEWFLFADKDLAAAEYLLSMQPQPLEIICFHCQQAVEKYLKGYLIFKGVEQPPKTHDLQLLRSLCLEYDSSFEGISTGCKFLTQLGVQPRYPDEMEIDESYTDRALKTARTIKDFIPLVKIRSALSL